MISWCLFPIFWIISCPPKLRHFRQDETTSTNKTKDILHINEQYYDYIFPSNVSVCWTSISLKQLLVSYKHSQTIIYSFLSEKTCMETSSSLSLSIKDLKLSSECLVKGPYRCFCPLRLYCSVDLPVLRMEIIRRALVNIKQPLTQRPWCSLALGREVALLKWEEPCLNNTFVPQGPPQTWLLWSYEVLCIIQILYYSILKEL